MDQATSREYSTQETNVLRPSFAGRDVDPMHSSTKGGFFRLITLSPGKWGDEIRCTLKIYDRIDNSFPPYKALSYVWGRWRRQNPPEILVNDDKVKVTTNLEIALKHLREQDEETVFWIDALVMIFSNVVGNHSLTDI